MSAMDRNGRAVLAVWSREWIGGGRWVGFEEEGWRGRCLDVDWWRRKVGVDGWDYPFCKYVFSFLLLFRVFSYIHKQRKKKVNTR